MKIATCLAPVNLAVIKYWGKRDEDLLIPINDSLSATLSLEQMRAKTTIMISPDFDENKIWLNGKEENFNNPRLSNALKEIKKLYLKENNKNQEELSWKIHICSENNFPTAAGLASSAAGYACLAYTLSKVYGIKQDVSSVARVGSGSAVRSMYGGWVQWLAGTRSDGADSIAKQIASEHHWPEMHVLILIVNANKKKISSTAGMRNTVRTSELIKHRAEKVVPKRITEITSAILNKDFELFGKLTMQDSNQFHACCLDTYPPCVYLNDISHEIINLCHRFNDYYGAVKVAYTFDAGPNACIYLLDNVVSEFLACIECMFPPTNLDVEFIQGIKSDLTTSVSEDLLSGIAGTKHPGALTHIIHTKVDSGPICLQDDAEHLLTNSGVPK